MYWKELQLGTEMVTLVAKVCVWNAGLGVSPWGGGSMNLVGGCFVGAVAAGFLAGVGAGLSAV